MQSHGRGPGVGPSFWPATYVVESEMTMGRQTAHFPQTPTAPMRCFRLRQGSIIVVAQAPGGIRLQSDGCHSRLWTIDRCLNVIVARRLISCMTKDGGSTEKTVSVGKQIVYVKELRDRNTPSSRYAFATRAGGQFPAHGHLAISLSHQAD